MIKEITIIPKNLSFPVARVLDKESQEFYQKVSRKTAENFGKDSLAYKTITNGINTNNVTGSQFFWNTNLGLYLPKEKRVCSLNDWENINDLDENFFRDFYTDSPQIVLRTDKTSYERNAPILKDLIEQVKGENYQFSSESPLILSNLDLIKDENTENRYGLLLKIGENTKIKNDERFVYSNNGKKIPFGDKQKTIYTRNDGLSRVYLYRGGDLIAGDGDLDNSDDFGRVVLLEDAEGVALKNKK